MFVASGLSEKQTSWPSVTPRRHILFWIPGTFSFQPFSASLFDFFIFYPLSLWSIRSLLSVPFSRFFNKTYTCICVCIDCWCRKFPHSVLSHPLHPSLSLCASALPVKTVAVCWLSNNTIQIQKLLFPSSWELLHTEFLATACYANEASFMGAANDGSPAEISADARRISTFFFLLFRYTSIK